MTVTVNDLEYEFYEKALAGTLPGGDGTGRQIIAGGLYATFVERDEYYGSPGNNYPSLFNSESRVTGVSAEGVFQIWGGDEAPASYDPSDWITV